MGLSVSNVITLTILTTVILSSVVIGDETCKTSKMVKRYMNSLYSCGKSLKFKDEHDKAAKMTCVLKCVLSSEGLLTKDGLVEKDILSKYLDREAPEFMKAKALALFSECIDEHGPTVDPGEESCRSYDPLLKCFVWASIQVFMNEFV